MKKEIIELCLKKVNGDINLTWEELAKNTHYKDGGSLSRSWRKHQKKKKNVIVSKKENDSINFKTISKIETTRDIYKNGEIISLKTERINMKPLNTEWSKEFIDNLFDKLDDFKKKEIKIDNISNSSEGLIIPIADFHYGLHSDTLSTGNEYNIDIAEQSIYNVITELINRVKGRKFDKIYFVIGNDFINSDNIQNTTTKGTPQDSDTSWFVIVDKIIDILINLIYIIKDLSNIVEVVYVPSNHDLHTMYAIMKVLKAFFRYTDNIIIDESPMMRKYIQYGNTLMGFTHDLKVRDALKIITTEGKKYWSDSENIIWFLAHLHQQMIYDKQGYLEIIRLPTFAGWSRWTNKEGYVQSDKKCKCFIVNKSDGITEEINIKIK